MKKISLSIILGIALISPIFAILDTYDIQEAYSKSYNYEKVGNYNESIKALSKVYTEYPVSYTVNLRLGYLYFKLNRPSNALDNYDKALQAIPNSIEAKAGKMWVLISQERHVEAEAVGYQILSIDPYNYLANLRLAYILRLLKKTDASEKIDLKMLSVFPTDTSFLNEYGALKFYTGNLDKASAIFESVLILDPTNSVAKNFSAALKKAHASEKK